MSGLAFPGAAFAGSNGQQIDVGSSHSYSEEICGDNQYNNYVCGWKNAPTYWTAFTGGWWKGTVTITYCYGYNLTRCYARGNYNIPTSQPQDWWYIQYN
jgi:hypothetical protein